MAPHAGQDGGLPCSRDFRPLPQGCLRFKRGRDASWVLGLWCLAPDLETDLPGVAFLIAVLMYVYTPPLASSAATGVSDQDRFTWIYAEVVIDETLVFAR